MNLIFLSMSHCSIFSGPNFCVLRSKDKYPAKETITTILSASQVVIVTLSLTTKSRCELRVFAGSQRTRGWTGCTIDASFAYPGPHTCRHCGKNRWREAYPSNSFHKHTCSMKAVGSCCWVWSFSLARSVHRTKNDVKREILTLRWGCLQQLSECNNGDWQAVETQMTKKVSRKRP